MRFPVTQGVPNIRGVIAADAVQILVFNKKAVISGGLCAGFVLASQSGDAESIADSVNAV